MLLSNKKEWTISTFNNLNESPGSYTKLKKPIPKGYILYGYIYITFLKWMFQELECFRIGKQIRGCQGLGMGTEGELWMWLWKGNKRHLCDETVLVSWCGDGHTNLHMWQNNIEHKKSTRKTEGIWIRSVDCQYQCQYHGCDTVL